MITGQQGSVMKESIMCAKTISWNLIPKDLKKSIQQDLKDDCYGIHIHCPEAATPKDGPSAGTAITLCILSLLTGIKIKNNVAITGEIDLNGNVLAVGGIDLKIEGGKSAGVDTILMPKSNKTDFESIKKTKPNIDDNIKIHFISNIWEAINLAFEENNLKFLDFDN